MAARTLVTATAVIVAAGLPTLWVLSLAFLAHVPVLGHGLRWCAEAFGAHQRVPAWAGVSALVVSSFGAARAVRVLRTQRRLRQDRAGAPQVIDNPEAFAFTLPGTGGQIVLSNGLVQLLDDDERDIVVAHERAHASFRHDRYVLAAQLANALLPPLRPS